MQCYCVVGLYCPPRPLSIIQAIAIMDFRQFTKVVARAAKNAGTSDGECSLGAIIWI